MKPSLPTVTAFNLLLFFSKKFRDFYPKEHLPLRQSVKLTAVSKMNQVVQKYFQDSARFGKFSMADG